MRNSLKSSAGDGKPAETPVWAKGMSLKLSSLGLKKPDFY